MNIKNPSDLKYYIEQSDNRFFFSRKTMCFFGDTMRNFGLRTTVVNGHECFELWRKRPVKLGLQGSHFFRKSDLKIMFSD